MAKSLSGKEDDRLEPGISSIELTDHDRREAARLLALIRNAPPEDVDALRRPMQPGTTRKLDQDPLLATVRKHVLERQLRNDYFNPSIFGEPAWDILLVLYISDHTGRRQTVRRLAHRVNTPLTTAIRWIDYLAKEHLVQKEPRPNYRRMMYVTLLDKGRGLLDDYFSSINQ